MADDVERIGKTKSTGKGVKVNAFRIRSKGKIVGTRIALVCGATLLFRYVLDFLYLRFVMRFYASDFLLGVNNPFRLLESYAIVLVLCIWIANSLYRRWRPSGIVLILYFIVIIVPLSSLYGLAEAPSLFIYAAVASIALLTIVRDLLQIKLKLIRPSRELVYMVITSLFGISIYVYGWLVFTGGLGRLNWDLLRVYDVRAEFASNLGPLMGYFFPWQGFVINIYGLLYAWERRKPFLLSIFTVAQLLLFGMTGHKSFLLAPFLAIGVYLIWQKRNFFFLAVMGATFLALASYGYFLITDNLIVPAIFVQRLFFLPAKLHLLYYDFFSQPNHPFYMLSDSILRRIVRNPYNMPMVRVIALTYWGRDSINPNVGYLGDAYANFGLLGMFLFSVILGVVLWIVDSVGSGLPSNFVAAIIAIPAMALTQSPLFTTLGTHGFILTILMLWITRVIRRDTI
jgi:oligosaccharide repeat unit polymerase